MKHTCLLIIIAVIIVIIFFAFQNNAVVITNYEYKNSKIPKSFDNFKILHISDFHNKNFYGRLNNKIKNINPDIIVISGDLIDRRNTKIEIAVNFAKQMVQTAPVYYVSGNHEQLSSSYEELKNELIKLDVRILDNSHIILTRDGSSIGLLGLADPSIMPGESNKNSNFRYAEIMIKSLFKNIDTDFNILLSHRPELFEIYKKMNVDLTFSGHAHGGQIRIPFVGAVLSPNQGLFPKYSEGMVTEGTASMVISRGLGNSLFPLRVFNRPELVVVTLGTLK